MLKLLYAHHCVRYLRLKKSKLPPKTVYINSKPTSKCIFNRKTIYPKSFLNKIITVFQKEKEKELEHSPQRKSLSENEESDHETAPGFSFGNKFSVFAAAAEVLEDDEDDIENIVKFLYFTSIILRYVS